MKTEIFDQQINLYLCNGDLSQGTYQIKYITSVKQNITKSDFISRH